MNRYTVQSEADRKTKQNEKRAVQDELLFLMGFDVTSSINIYRLPALILIQYGYSKFKRKSDEL